MKDLILRLTKHDNPNDMLELQNYCTNINLSNSFTQIAAELSFELPYATTSPSLLAINIELGDRVTLWYKEKQVFLGKVIDMNLKGKGQQLRVDCYDYCWWICKSNITKNFSNISILQALADVYNEIGAKYKIDDELGDNGNIILESYLVKDKPVSKVLSAIYAEITKRTGLYYYMHQNDFGVCTITEADKYFSGLTIQPPTSKNAANGNLIDYEISESMQNMVTRVAIYNEDGSRAPVYGTDEYGKGENIIMLDHINLTRWGIIQDSVTIESDMDISKAKNEAEELLKSKSTPSEELMVTCIGDIDYKVAYGVLAKIPGTNYYDKFMYIISSEWSWNKDGTFISKVSLSPSKHHDLIEFTDIEEKQEDNSSTTVGNASDLVNRITTELKKHLGLPYKWAGKSPADGGMDCSGYISYVYNQFSSELEINAIGRKLTPPTQVMMHQGKDVTKDFPNNLRECDIIFPHEGHVVAYIGNNQVIHEPKSGDVCKISDIYFSNVAKVIRVVPDSAWNTSNENTGGTNDGTASSKLIEFIKGWESFKPNVYDDGYGTLTIGYGTTAKDKVAKGSCTQSEATKWVQDEANQFANTIKKVLDKDNISLPQNKFDCLVDIAYNNGTRDLIGGNTWNAIVKGDDKNTITKYILSWNHANGSVSQGLTKRCAARVRIFFDGVYDSTH